MFDEMTAVGLYLHMDPFPNWQISLLMLREQAGALWVNSSLQIYHHRNDFIETAFKKNIYI